MNHDQAFSRSEFDALVTRSNRGGLSLYMPTAISGSAVEKNRIRFKNLVGEARRRLARLGRDRPAGVAEESVKATERLVEDAEFWRHQRRGLALFVTEDFSRRYRLPLRFDERLVIDRRFHVRPLLPLLALDRACYVLCLSRERVRLYAVNLYATVEIKPRQMPTLLTEVVQAEPNEAHLQFHTGTPHRTGRRAAQYHGHGGGNDDDRQELRRFYGAVEAGLAGELEDRQAPLVLAGLEHLSTVFREICTHPGLAETDLATNPDTLEPDELGRRARAIVRRVLDAERLAARAELEHLAATRPERTSNRLDEIVPASVDGRVAALFLPRDAPPQWGTFDPVSRDVGLHETQPDAGGDLLDLAAVETQKRGGRLHLLEADELPGFGPVAAVFRY